MLFGAVLGAAFVGVFHANSVGLTGPGFIFEAMALTGRRELRGYFSGQNLALAVIGVPLLIVIAFGLAIAARRPVYGFLGMAVALAGLGAALAMSNIFTVVLPYPMEQRAGSPMRRAAEGYGAGTCGHPRQPGRRRGTVIPVIVGAALTRLDPAAVRMPVLAAAAAVYGITLAWVAERIAARAAEPGLPELYQIAVRSKL